MQAAFYLHSQLVGTVFFMLNDREKPSITTIYAVRGCILRSRLPRLCYRVQGLSVLRNRGYDSAGMATATQDSLFVSKFASSGEFDGWICQRQTRNERIRMIAWKNLSKRTAVRMDV